MFEKFKGCKASVENTSGMKINSKAVRVDRGGK